jgi:lysophospholipase L1-like esterase
MNSDRIYSVLVPIIGPIVTMQGQRRQQKFTQLPPPAGRVVFLGDSITEWGWWDEFFPDLPVVNRGIGGNTTTDVLNRLDSAIVEPRAVSLMIGTNDLHGPRSARDITGIAERTQKIVRRIRTKAPEAKLLLNSVLPRSPLWAPRVRALNALYRSVAEEEDIQFVDLWPVYADAHGGLLKAHTSDNLHLTIPGYQPWVEILRPLLSSDDALAQPKPRLEELLEQAEPGSEISAAAESRD